MTKTKKEKLLLSIVDILNYATYEGKYELSNVSCKTDNIEIDYLYLLSEINCSINMENEAVCFF